LTAVLLDESDLVEFLRQASREPLPATRQGAMHGLLPVRRPLIPETSELVRVEVLLERRGDGWEVTALRGLDHP
jgi:hypothetical protein